MGDSSGVAEVPLSGETFGVSSFRPPCGHGSYGRDTGSSLGGLTGGYGHPSVSM